MSINVICATDNDFAPYCGVMLTSLFENNRKSKLSVFVLVDESFSSRNQQKYKQLGTKYGQALHIVKVDSKQTADFPVNQSFYHISQPTYYRILATQLLPREVSKVLYLDCDIIVAGSLEPMWATDLEGKAIAGVKDGWMTFENNSYDHLHYDRKYGYFNAGVVMLNLDYWRQHDIETRLLNYIRENHDNLPYMDQDVLNGTLHESTEWLPERYNLQTKNLYKAYWTDFPEHYQNTLMQELSQAVIIHYCGRHKPWNYRYSGGPYHSLWEHYRRLSPYKCCRVRRPIGKYLKRRTKDLLFPSKREKRLAATWQITV